VLLNLTSTIVNLLRSNVPNPHPSGEFIYADYPRMDATFPRISVTQVSGNVDTVGIGEWGPDKKADYYVLTYDIDIWVGVKDRAMIDGETYVGTKLRDKYAEIVLRTLLDSKETLRSNKVIDVDVVGISTLPLDEEYMLHRKTITVRFTVEREEGT